MLFCRITLLAIFLLSSLNFAQGSQGSNENSEILAPLGTKNLSVSIIELIANPEKYNGKAIQVEGFLNIEFEGTALYLHKEDLDYSISKNAIWVSFKSKEEVFELKDKFGRKYVLLEGTFSSESNGHFGLFSGSIRDITRLDILEKRGN